MRLHFTLTFCVSQLIQVFSVLVYIIRLHLYYLVVIFCYIIKDMVISLGDTTLPVSYKILPRPSNFGLTCSIFRHSI